MKGKQETKVWKSAFERRVCLTEEKTLTKKAQSKIIDLEDIEDEKDMKIKQRDIEMVILIALREEMDEEFVRGANK